MTSGAGARRRRSTYNRLRKSRAGNKNTDKEVNVSKDRLINETIRSDGIKTNK